ncbi:MAG TPA: glycosyl hydrolase [Acidimicrobiia bacterium]|nr:glycosyl hydrolase [Acidimicrobiia bacterium]
MATALLPSRRTGLKLWVGVTLALLGGALAPASAAEDEATTEEESSGYEPVAGWVAPPRNPGRLAPATGALMGVHSHDSTNMSPEDQGIVKLEAALGRHMDINNHYHGEWESIAEDGLSWLEEWDVQSGRIPLVGWGCYDSSKIISGSEDDIIRRTAQQMKAFGHEFFMRYCWEMDGARKQGTVKSAEKFNEAWRRMHRIFQEEGATNVIWTWTANAAGFKDKRKYTNNEPPAPYFYPGDEYVDWIAADGYNWGVSKRNQGDRWRQVLEIFDEFMVFARAHPKPIMIGEYGAQEQRDDPAAKPEWMRQAHDTVMNKPRTEACPWCGAYSDVAAIVYFDVDYGSHGDWRIMSSDATLAAYKEASDDPWFHQMDNVPWPSGANRTRPAGQAAPKPGDAPESTDPSDSTSSPPEEDVDQPEPPGPDTEDGTAPEQPASSDPGPQPEPAGPPAGDSQTQPAPSDQSTPPDQSDQSDQDSQTGSDEPKKSSSKTRQSKSDRQPEKGSGKGSERR